MPRIILAILMVALVFTNAYAEDAPPAQPPAEAQPAPSTHTVAAKPLKIEVTIDGIFEARESSEIAIVPKVWQQYRVVWAIEEWARVKAQTPKGEKSLDPLPREELIAFLERCGEAARPALEASLAKKHGACSVIERALERIGSAKG